MRKLGHYAVLLVVLFFVIPNYAQNSKATTKEKIVGTVIAQYSMNALMCVYHPCAVWLLIRLDGSRYSHHSFARVAVEYFPPAFPKDLVDKSQKWKFSAVRDASGDRAVERFINFADNAGQNAKDKAAIAAWILVPGAENETVPVGEILPYYFVKTGKFERSGKR